MESVFYYDNIVREYERQNMYNNIIYYLEDKYRQEQDERLFSTYIAYLWYFFVEGDVNKNVIDYDWGFFYSRLKKAIILGLEKFPNSGKLCFVVGYILSLHWMNIDAKYEKKGEELLRKALDITTDSKLRDLVSYVIKQRKSVLNASNVRLLFPTESILDEYFIGVFKD